SCFIPLFVFCLMASFSKGALAQTKTIRIANWLPPMHTLVKMLNVWGKELSAASGGSLKIEIMKAPLAKPPGQYDLVKKNVADMAWAVAAWSPKRFHLLRAIDMPFLFSSAEVGSAGLWDWYDKNNFADKEFSDSKLVGAFVNPPHLYHSNKKLTVLGDLKGQKIRAGGNGIGILKKLGAAPLFLSPGSTTQALQKGTIDGTQFPWEALKGFRLIKHSKYHLVIPNGLYTNAWWFSMSKKTWGSLTSSQKKAIKGVGLSGSRLVGKGWDKSDAEAKQAVVKSGNTITVLNDADTAKLKKIVSYVEEGWVAKTNKMGLDGKALLTDLRQTIGKYKK
ncbi:MAG: TRAP transporter substrate-binding protein, partial [Pseudomonadota bacterium]|nr:TRAP transporter substrate-binding protein [Pseudomonadota bacterium]